MKKLVSLLMALAMIFALAAGAFATQVTETGSITINGASAENTYTVYKLLDLESYDTEKGVYSYKVNAAWAGFFAEGAEGRNYFAVDDNDYATWTAAEDGDTVAAFAKKALAYAEANDIDFIKTTENTGDYTTIQGGIKFENLELGYYLVDSTMGALCGLTTTNPNASINAKNGSPSIDKQVKEDSTENWGGTNTADIGQTVEFRTTISVHAGAQNYVMHDKMSAGLTFQGVSKIERVIPGVKTETVDTSLYTVVTENLGDDCTFHVVFSQAFCDSLETNDKVIVYYSAMLNRNAVVGPESDDSQGNPNETWLDFGDDHHTTHDTTNTFTFGFDIVKTDSQNKLIDGAEFKIYDAAEGGNEVAVVLMDDGVTYRRARANEDGVNIAVDNGKVRVVGFDNGTYYLEEVVSPAGYNKLTARQKFIIADNNLDSIFNGDIYSTGSGVHVVNKSGTMLPETGAAGTMMFITFGTITVLAAGVLLVTKKRMSMIVD